ncbi:MAG: hypothetical protein LBU53_12220 [Zoogloeaceae bacterium]|jgi:hypothetical protein|nr:hypothetical protein [Zoogloeaceae bacterium]
MLKKLAFVLALLLAALLTLLQILLLAVRGHFADMFQLFGAELSAYTLLFLNTWALWWSLPALCIALMFWANKRSSGSRVVLALFMSLLGFVAIAAALYSPIFKCGCIID